MIGRHRIGLLSQALLMLGVVPMADAVARMAEREEMELIEVMRVLAGANRAEREGDAHTGAHLDEAGRTIFVDE